MTARIMISGLLCCLYLSPAGAQQQGDQTINPWMVEALCACLNAQRSIGNPWIDVETGLVDKAIVEKYVVDFMIVPDHCPYHILFRTRKAYDPSGAYFSCRLRASDNVVLQAAYYHGDVRSDGNLEQVFIDDKRHNCFSDQEPDVIMKKTRVLTLSLEAIVEKLYDPGIDCPIKR